MPSASSLSVEANAPIVGANRIRLSYVSPHPHLSILLQCAACEIPLVLGFYAGYPLASGRVFVGLLSAFLAYEALKKRPFHFISLLVACLPVLTVIRGTLVFFNIITLLLGCAITWVLIAPQEFSEFRSKKPLLYFIIVTVLYWQATTLFTARYAGNIRALEWSLSAAAIMMLSARRSFLSTALLGVGISTVAVGVGLLPFGERLGMGDVDGYGMGNPILLGLPAALVFLLCVAEGGRWLLLQRHSNWRMALSLACGVFLVLSTSRGSWLVVFVAALLLLFLDSSSRFPLLVSCAGLAVAVTLLLSSSRLAIVQHYFDKMADSKSSLASRTDGRSEQWLAFPRVLHDSPVWGFGPGSGVDVSLRYAGKKLPFHSLYLHFGAETGIIGLTLLAFLLGTLVRTGIRHRRVCGEVVPLMAIVAFITLGLTVIGMDSLGGMWVGLAMIGGNRENFWRVRTVSTTVAAATAASH